MCSPHCRLSGVHQSLIFCLWEQSLLVSVICLPLSLWEISLWRKSGFSAFVFHIQTEAFFRMYLKAVFQRMDSHDFFPSCFSNQILKRKTQLLIPWNACFYDIDLCHSKWPKDTITSGIYGCISSAGNIFPYKLENKVF